MTDHHQHGTEIDWDAMGPLLELEGEVQIPLLEQAAGWLRGRSGGVRRVLDAGSGPGVMSCLLAREFPEAEVVAVDSGRELLDRAERRAAGQGLAERVRTHLADLPGGLDPVGPVDLVWSSKAVHHLGDQVAALAALARCLSPGGILAVSEGGLPRRWLPRDIGIGRPGLQERLDALNADRFTEMRAALPGAKSEVEDWSALLAAAGLEPVGTRTFLLDLPAPAAPGVREFVAADLARLREKLADRIDADDRATLGRLADPDDPEGILRRPDVFLLSAQTVHAARRPGPDS
ncbi:class I SAM-dependent methyltransferase [Streptomyces sp. bgisy100]|uniref:class I SAM-dependent methyltransferase n=1 Tax=Streptomyces sp. bgisy100 TaxID=3413783 RepID=UPI003D71C0DE